MAVAKILVVDDEPDVEQVIRQRFRRKMRDGEIDFVFAGNGVEALDAIRHDPDIDLVLTDIRMPHMDGLTLLDQLGRLDPMIKAVVVSAYGDMKNIRTAMNRGAFDFVTKPIDFKDLEVTLEKTLKHSQQLRDALMARDGLVAIRKELEVAAHIQQALLPTEFPSNDSYEMYATMCPAKDIAGDFYDFFQVAPDRLGFAVADVSDKGTPAALFMAVSRTLLRAVATSGMSPGPCLRRVNELLCADNKSGMFATLFYGLLDTTSGDVTYANGGHCAPFLFGGTDGVRPLEMTGGMALGVVDSAEYVEKNITLDAGESLFLYTDGVTEAIDRDGAEFGTSRLIEFLETGGALDPTTLIRKITEVVNSFASTEKPFDDITCMTIRRKGANKASESDKGNSSPDKTPNKPVQSGQSGQPATEGQLTMTLVNRLGEVQRIPAILQGFAADNGLSDKIVLDLNLVLEELLINTISYGYDDDREHEIEIRLSLQSGILTV
ncbi:MAG: SpoIIE family protein phosphatase, partial [Pseudomonadota bacterium]